MARETRPEQVEGGRSETSRLETFADGVMAIAITLLILEIAVPHVEPGQSLLRALGDQWPSYAAYAVSFMTIGIIWVNHHHLFGVIERTSHAFLMLNVVFLMTIAALPWPTALVAEYIRDPVERTTAAVVYGANMTAIAVMFNAVWRYAAHGLRLLPRDVDPAALRRVNLSYLSGPLTYAAGTAVAFVSPLSSVAIYGALALYWLLPGSSPRIERLRRGPTRA